MKKIILSTLTTIALLNTSIMADEIMEQLNEAIKAYQEKDYKGAMDELKFITAQLQKLDAEENQKLLPKPLEGWKFEATSSGGMAMAGGTSMQGNYSKENQNIEIQIIANSPMISMMSMAISNPALMAADPNTSPYRYKRNKGMKKKDGDTIEITLLIAGQIMIKLTGSQLSDDAVLEQYLNLIDIKKLKNELL